MSDWKSFHIFNNVGNESITNEELEDLKEALCITKSSVPEKVDYEERIMSFKTALNYLKDEEVSTEIKNQFLKEIIEDMTFDRPKPIRLTKKLAKELGVDYPHRLCWHNYPFELNVTLRV